MASLTRPETRSNSGHRKASPSGSRGRLEHASSYTVGWLAALPLERAAAHQMLDVRHDAPKDFRKAPNDNNNYSWGCIGDHNVVIASLPAGDYGIRPAAATAASMLASLPHIKFNLLVGIGAGVAREDTNTQGTKRDIRLGDVAVSSPEGVAGGVIQYDLVKALSTDSFGQLQRKGFLNSPPPVLRNALAGLQADHLTEESRMAGFLQVFGENPLTAGPSSYGYPGAERDRLRVADMTSGRAAHRDCPKIHYGTIASGNTLIKSAEHRDAIIAQLRQENIDPICFEMEAAGLMNEFPCLVIRGISDYADEHKNDDWQKYAAATAAAFAKELLTYITVGEVDDTEEHRALVEQLGLEVHEFTSTYQNEVKSNLHREVLDWICPTEYSMQLQDNLDKCQPDTGQWFLGDDRFLRWAHSYSQGTLFCPGDPGNGKTMIAAMAIRHLLDHVMNQQYPVLYAFCSYSRQKEQTARHLISSLLRQLLSQIDNTTPSIQKMYNKHVDKKTRPTMIELQDAFQQTAQGTRGIHIILDAIDECRDKDTLDLINCIQNLMATSRRSNICLMVTSRHKPTIKSLFEGPKNDRVEIRATPDDVRKYVLSRAKEVSEPIRRDSELLEHIVQGVVRRADQTFLLAQLHMDILVNEVKPIPRQIKKALDRLPTGAGAYIKAYSAAMLRLSAQPEAKASIAKRALMWIVHANRPLSPKELVHAVSIEYGQVEIDIEDVADVETIISVCDGLVKIDKQSQIVRLVHQTTKEYLLENSTQWFPNADRHLAQSCMTYLSLQKFKEGPTPTDAEASRRIMQYPLLRYAAANWGYHLKDVELNGCVADLQALRKTTSDFLGQASLVATAVQAMDLDAHPHNTSGNYAKQSTACHLLAHFDLTKTFETIPGISRDFNASNSYGRTPISYAAQYGCEGMLDLLLQSKEVTVDLKDISQAIVHGQDGVMQLLLHRIDPDARGDKNRTALSLAARVGQKDQVRMLLERYNVDPDSRDNLGRTPLSYAAEYGHPNTAESLLRSGKVDIHSRDHEGRTPFERAALGGHRLTCEVLVRELRKDTGKYLESIWETYKLVLVECRHWAARVRRGDYVRSDLQAAAQAGSSAVILEELEPGLLNKPEAIEGVSAEQYLLLIWYLQGTIICDRCEKPSVSHGFHCRDCPGRPEYDNAHFDVCAQCFEKGHWCLNEQHRLLEYNASPQSLFTLHSRTFELEPEDGDVVDQHVLTKYRTGKRGCDLCLKKGIDHGYHCRLCVDGRFDVCYNCIKKGKWCRDKSHKLRCYRVEKGFLSSIPRRSYGKAGDEELTSGVRSEDLTPFDDCDDRSDTSTDTLLASFHSALSK